MSSLYIFKADAAPLHHVGQLVRDLSKATVRLTKTFGYVVESDRIDDHQQGATVQFLRQPGARHWLELITPLDASSHLHRALAKRVVFHHCCYEVSNIEACDDGLSELGWFRLAEPVPAVAFEGLRIAWYMSDDNELIELVESGDSRLSLSSLDRHERTI